MDNTFGNKIKELREERKLTQTELAKDLGIYQTQVSKIELGSIEPNLDLIRKFARYFNVTADFLLGLEDYY